MASSTAVFGVVVLMAVVLSVTPGALGRAGGEGLGPAGFVVP